MTNVCSIITFSSMVPNKKHVINSWNVNTGSATKHFSDNVESPISPLEKAYKSYKTLFTSYFYWLKYVYILNIYKNMFKYHFLIYSNSWYTSY